MQAFVPGASAYWPGAQGAHPLLVAYCPGEHRLAGVDAGVDADDNGVGGGVGAGVGAGVGLNVVLDLSAGVGA